MPRNSGQTLNVQNTLGGNLLPLRNCLRRHRADGFGEGGRATSFLFCKFTCVFHNRIESITYITMQASLSVKVALS